MRMFGGSIVGAMLVASAFAPYPQIEVFTTAGYPTPIVTGSTVRVYTLDAPAALEAELTAALPRDPSHAYAFAQRAVKEQWREPAKRLTEAYQGLLKARHYELAKIPAIVFDGRAVLYGVTDLEQALGDYGHWQERAR